MLSYNDIVSYKFEKAGFGGGYRPEDVDKFTNRVALDFQKLEQEKSELEQKLMALAEKIEEYRADEESLRAALLGAQKLGDSIIRESKQKSEAMLSAARSDAERIVNEGRRQVEREQIALTKIQKEVSNFKNRLLILYKQHLELISSIPGQDVQVDAQEILNVSQPPRAVSGKPAPATQQEPVSEPVMTEPNEGTAAAPAKQADLPAEAPIEETAAHESRFGELQFGEGFDLHHA